MFGIMLLLLGGREKWVVCSTLRRRSVVGIYRLKLNCHLECVLPFWNKHLRCISKPAKIHETYQLLSVDTDIHRRVEGARRILEHSFSDLQVWRGKVEDYRGHRWIYVSSWRLWLWHKKQNAKVKNCLCRCYWKIVLFYLWCFVMLQWWIPKSME